MIKQRLIRIGMVSLGCPKTLVDSETILGKLQDKRFKIVENIEESDVVLLNTCGFIKDAQQESIDAIFRLVELKKQKKLLGLIVMGCLVQRYPQELEKEFREVDAFVGSGDYDKIAGVLKKVVDGQKMVSIHKAGYLAKADEPRIPLTPKFYRYLKISEGCDHSCSFCVIPQLRGKFRSRRIPDLVKEARILARQGAKELILIGQDITKFGYDYAQKPLLLELLKKLEAIDGIKWIRLLYAYPSSITDEVIQMIATSRKICHYIDLPLQHINDRILTAMRRGIGKKKVIALIQKLRAVIPDLVIRTSFIVGFPGETQKEFEELLEFMSLAKFERLGIFKYSREKGSLAAEMKNQIPERVKEKRFHYAMQLQQKISWKVNRRALGATLEVLVEKKDCAIPRVWLGRSFMDAPDIDGNVLIHSFQNLKPGNFYPVSITDTKTYDLVGQI